ncbi:MAG: exodeoxyribonuclease III [Micavibrio sp.]|nr:exodeoxyribonuclease III [Micavibrio sp.]|tara:strand:- start:5906 stop:6694 length:789 start_codon:yes stop_codon:yes gene_type:complete
MRIATWNINSVRLRAPLVKKLGEMRSPDILCLQETKTPDEHFPFEAMREAGYEHIHIHGMKGYNGLAILSKLPFVATDIHHRCGQEDCRHIAASFDGFELHNLYIPAGGDEPDPEANEKFAHKLDFVNEMAEWFENRYVSDQALVAVGDFNIAPYEHDVWSHKQLLKVVSHTPPETEALEKMRASLDWVDSARHFVDMDKKCYTWWSYRNRDWKKSNRGRRLDHVWVTRPLESSLSGHEVLSEARDWEKPSDHAPVLIDFEF